MGTDIRSRGLSWSVFETASATRVFCGRDGLQIQEHEYQTDADAGKKQQQTEPIVKNYGDHAMSIATSALAA